MQNLAELVFTYFSKAEEMQFTKSINQSINQSNFYSANIPGVARLSGATQWRNSQISVQIQSHFGFSETLTGCYARRCLPGEGQVVLRRLLQVATELAELTDSERLFQRERAQELKALAPVMVLTLGMDRVIPLFDLSERNGREMAIKERR